MVCIDQRLNISRANTKDQIFGICFDDFGSEVKNPCFGEWLKMIVD